MVLIQKQKIPNFPPTMKRWFGLSLWEGNWEEDFLVILKAYHVESCLVHTKVKWAQNPCSWMTLFLSKSMELSRIKIPEKSFRLLLSEEEHFKGFPE